MTGPEILRETARTTGTTSKTGAASNSSIQTDTAAGRAHALSEIGKALAEFDQDIEQSTSMPMSAAEIENERVVSHLMKNAIVLVKAGEGRLAFNLLRTVLIRKPEHAEALKLMGRCLRDENRLEEALKCFRAYAKIERTPEANALVAEVLYLCERDDAALASYREVLRAVVSDEALLFDIYKNVGNIHVRAGDYDAAEEFYDKAYTLQPESHVLLVNYGTLEIQRGNWDEAVTRFRRAVEINPNSDRAWVGLAMVHRTMGDLELAKANLERALDINGGNRTALRLAVDWAAQDHDFGSAILRLQDYVSTQGGEDAEMAFTLAKVLVQAGRLHDARIETERVLALDPEFANAENLARVLDQHIHAMKVEQAS